MMHGDGERCEVVGTSLFTITVTTTSQPLITLLDIIIIMES